MVNAAQEPSASHLMLDVVNAFPGRLRTWAVCHPQEKAGDELDTQGEDQSAAPHVAPAGTARDVFVKRVANDSPIPNALIQPVLEPRDHARGIFLASPARKFWNFTQTSFSLRISTS